MVQCISHFRFFGSSARSCSHCENPTSDASCRFYFSPYFTVPLVNCFSRACYAWVINVQNLFQISSEQSLNLFTPHPNYSRIIFVEWLLIRFISLNRLKKYKGVRVNNSMTEPLSSQPLGLRYYKYVELRHTKFRQVRLKIFGAEFICSACNTSDV